MIRKCKCPGYKDKKERIISEDREAEAQRLKEAEPVNMEAELAKTRVLALYPPWWWGNDGVSVGRLVASCEYVG